MRLLGNDCLHDDIGCHILVCITTHRLGSHLDSRIFGPLACQRSVNMVGEENWHVAGFVCPPNFVKDNPRFRCSWCEHTWVFSHEYLEPYHNNLKVFHFFYGFTVSRCNDHEQGHCRVLARPRISYLLSNWREENKMISFILMVWVNVERVGRSNCNKTRILSTEITKSSCTC